MPAIKIAVVFSVKDYQQKNDMIRGNLIPPSPELVMIIKTFVNTVGSGDQMSI
jgi:hypothetical protein